MKTTTEMQLVPIAKLVPYVNNARTHSPEQITKLRSSLREFGFVNPVIIDRDFNVIAGHGRILAAKEEGIAEVPCVFADHLSEAQKKAYIIADNRMAMDAGWDEELLRVEIESLQGMDFDPLLTGFDEKELAALFDDGIEAKEDDFDVDAELQKPTFTKSGDVWTLGRHRLVCGDSTKAETYTLLMDGVKANLVITDPPYNVNYEGSAGKIKNDNMVGEKFYEFLLTAFKNMESVMAADASIYVVHADTEGLNVRRAFADAGFYLSGCCIWKKQSLEIPLDKVAVGNLTRLLDAKGNLIKKALGISGLPMEVREDRVAFPWFVELPDADAVRAYTHFISALCEMSKNAKRVTVTEKAVENEKYAFRCFLLRLGFIGAEYKAERKILLKNLTGSSAFKSGSKKEVPGDGISE